MWPILIITTVKLWQLQMDADEPHNRCKNRNLAQTNFGKRLCGKPLVGKRQYRQYTQVFNLKDSLISLEFLIHIVNFFSQYEWRKKIKPINTGIWIKNIYWYFQLKKNSMSFEKYKSDGCEPYLKQVPRTSRN